MPKKPNEIIIMRQSYDDVEEKAFRESVLPGISLLVESWNKRNEGNRHRILAVTDDTGGKK